MRAPVLRVATTVLCALALALPAGAATTTTTDPQVPVAAARAYAAALLQRAALPAGARAVTRAQMPFSLLDAAGTTSESGRTDLSRTYLVPGVLDPASFLATHLPPRARLAGSGSSSGPGSHDERFASASLHCADVHVSFCQLDYSAATAGPAGPTYLRLDLTVVYLRLDPLVVPAGTLTLTGYARFSLMNPSSGPVSVTLDSAQAARLRGDLARARPVGTTMCMENSVVARLRVATRPGGPVIWRALIMACPGVILVDFPHARPPSSAQGCALRADLRSLLPRAAVASRQWARTEGCS